MSETVDLHVSTAIASALVLEAKCQVSLNSVSTQMVLY